MQAETRHLVLLAEYNTWMNAKVYSTCAGMPESQLYEDRGAFFKSIYLTLNHIACVDLAFLARFTGHPAEVPPADADLYGGFAALRAERAALDARIEAWIATLTPQWLASTLTYVSKIDQRERTLPNWALLTQVFNHQTHHRGQVTTLLTQMGRDVGSTDIPFMRRYGASELNARRSGPQPFSVAA